jgi:hypothetical protein
MNTNYLRAIAARLIEHANDLDVLRTGGKIAGLFDEFGAPPIDAASTEAEIRRLINLLAEQMAA